MASDLRGSKLENLYLQVQLYYFCFLDLASFRPRQGIWEGHKGGRSHGEPVCSCFHFTFVTLRFLHSVGLDLLFSNNLTALKWQKMSVVVILLHKGIHHTWKVNADGLRQSGNRNMSPHCAPHRCSLSLTHTCKCNGWMLSTSFVSSPCREAADLLPEAGKW